jgi:Zn finger protein HypA/HybF involved in hydrogenase expression
MEKGKGYKKAHKELWKAINKGEYDNQKVKCKKCGKTKNLRFHHEDYRKPFKTIILCQSCHSKRHKLEKNFKKAYLKMKRNKFGRFGDEKPIEKIVCKNCGKKTYKQNPKQKYCKKCKIKLNTRHLKKSKLKQLNN